MSTTPPPPPAPGQQAATKTNGLAIASLILPLLLGALGGIAGLILGNKAKRQIDESGGRQTGRGLATAGIIVSWVAIALTTLLIIIVVASS
jgi:hypothetical protein